MQMTDFENQSFCKKLSENENIEEMESSTGTRFLAPTPQWIFLTSLKPDFSLLTLFVGMLRSRGYDNEVVLSTVAIRFVDLDNKVDWKKWIKERSNWSEKKQESAISLIEDIEKYSDKFANDPKFEKIAKDFVKTQNFQKLGEDVSSILKEKNDDLKGTIKINTVAKDDDWNVN